MMILAFVSRKSFCRSQCGQQSIERSGPPSPEVVLEGTGRTIDQTADSGDHTLITKIIKLATWHVSIPSDSKNQMYSSCRCVFFTSGPSVFLVTFDTADLSLLDLQSLI